MSKFACVGDEEKDKVVNVPCPPEEPTPTADPGKPVPAIRIAIQNQVGTTKIINFETYVDQITPVTVLDALLDRLMEASDRQVRKYELVDLKNNLLQRENELRGLYDMKAAHEALLVPKEVEGRRNGVVTNESKIKAEVKNYENSIAERKKFIQKLKLDIADREKALA
jgi:hypothetical protein